jgi:putative hydroxymethylpyrimidine transport system ATP-binding protein
VNHSLIRIRNAALAYSGQQIFAQLHLDLPAGKWLGLLGPSGVGKSSLLRLLAGLTTPQETASVEIESSSPLPQQIAYMAQTDLLLPWLSVLNNAILGCKLRRTTRLQQQTAIDQAIDLLQQVGLIDALHLYPHQLSGGMRQRVALVRTLMENKPIVLMDEPFSSLDAITRYKLQNRAATMLAGKTVLFITHDPSEALRLADDIYIMQGQPATLKWITRLETAAPRDLHSTEMLALQHTLLQELTQAAGDKQ